ncbi:uncharacterized protein ARMOST_22568 [Armillaria ostoyae]|uniref:Uncharacterized protein n=1 Tax=Armillaria ostoyae TaxID=47428 RepID=A0A284SD96_ARMOS|nr:uncharacterized protein ARMOST_22568 [Armillaria ostoyae]
MLLQASSLVGLIAVHAPFVTLVFDNLVIWKTENRRSGWDNSLNAQSDDDGQHPAIASFIAPCIALQPKAYCEGFIPVALIATCSVISIKSHTTTFLWKYAGSNRPPKSWAFTV